MICLRQSRHLQKKMLKLLLIQMIREFVTKEMCIRDSYMEEAVLADRVVVMDAGKILTQGTPEEVFSQAELLKKHRLDVPQATELAYRLRGCGVKFDKLPLNAEQCVKMLEEVLS